MPRIRVVCVSGGFDPLHVGHVRLFKAAKLHGNWLHVIVNNDNWLMKKKGFVFMPEQERLEIVRSMFPVDEASLTDHELSYPAMSVCRSIAEVRPDVFCNGGDRRTEEDIPEAELCAALGIEMIFNVGGDKGSGTW